MDIIRGLVAVVIEDANFSQWETDEQREADEEWSRAFRVQLRDSMTIQAIVCRKMLIFAQSLIYQTWQNF